MNVKFWCDHVDFWLNEIREGKLAEWDPVNGTFHLGVAVLEYDWIDIELNLQSANEPDGDVYTCTPELSYFCCVKGIRDNKTEDWSDAGYLDDYGYEVDVDWNADDWPEQLERDMAEKLKEFAERFGLHYDKPNWVGDEHDFDVFDRLNIPFK